MSTIESDHNGAPKKPADVTMTLEGVASCVIRPRRWLGDSFAAYQRACAGARYDAVRKVGVVPIDRAAVVVRRLREEGFSIDPSPEVLEALEKHTAAAWLDVLGVRDRIEALDKQLRKNGHALRDYQRTGAEWLANRRRAVLSDEQGLGKTLQTLASLPPDPALVVVCPATVKSEWAREARKWRPNLHVSVLEGKTSFRWPEHGEMVVLNYDILPHAHKETCEDKRCRGCARVLDVPSGAVLVGDEAHKVKNPKAQRSQAFRYLASKVREKHGRVVVLTGTPIQNRPDELYAVFQAADVDGEAFGTRKEFERMFGATKETIFVKGHTKAHPKTRVVTRWGTPSDEAIDAMRRVFLRRTKADVAKELPPKQYKTVVVDLDPKVLKKCDELVAAVGGVDKLLSLIQGQKKIPFEKVSEVRAALASAKIPAMLEAIDSYEEAEEPVIVFSSHRAPVDVLEGRDGWMLITGSTSQKLRTEAVERFQAGELRGLAATIAAAGTGITLTRASNVVFVDRSWNPADNWQAEDRAHRIGTTSPVLITNLVAAHVLDERVHEVLMDKSALFAASVDRAREVSP